MVYLSLLKPILLAAALALLTAPVLSRPLSSLVGRFLPRLSEHVRRKMVGVAAAVVIVAVLVTPVVVLLVTTTGSISDVAEMVVGLVVNDQSRLDELHNILAGQVEQLNRMYPRLHLDRADIPGRIMELLREARGFGPAVVGFLFRGTGRVAEIALALISLAFFIAEGPRLVDALLVYSPLSDEQKNHLVDRHRKVVVRLLADTVGTAVAKGLVLGLVAWSVDRVVGFDRFSYPLIAILGAFISLLPLVGVTIVWLPLAVILWTADHPVAAAVLAVASLVGASAIDRLRRNLFRGLDDRGSWMSFLLFLSLIGGLLTFGLSGFVIGPMAVVLIYGLGSFWLPLYGIGGSEIGNPEISRAE
jgi:predicted PurR-regulated permease PerM